MGTTRQLTRCQALLVSSQSLYDVLGVAEAADTADIKAAFRAKAKLLHPDVNPEVTAAEEFKKVAAAYEILGDPSRRAAYDYRWQYSQVSGGSEDEQDDGGPWSQAVQRMDAALQEAERARRLAQRVRREAEAARRHAKRQAEEARRQVAEARKAAAAAAAAARVAPDEAGPGHAPPFPTGAATSASGASSSSRPQSQAAGAVPGAADDGNSTAQQSQQQPPASSSSSRPNGSATRGHARPGRAAAGGSSTSGPKQPGDGPAATAPIIMDKEALREQRAAARATEREAKRQARAARRHASQVRYWAQWAEQEVVAAKRDYAEQAKGGARSKASGPKSGGG